MSESWPFAEHWVAAGDGLQLYVRDYGGPETGKPGQLPLVCLAGLTRNGRDFHRLAVALSTAQTPRRVVTIDTRGRGGSERDADPAHYSVPQETSDVIAACAALEIERAAFVGTSRGGLILHIIAAVKPALLGAVILNDIGPVLAVDGLKHIQSYLGARSTFSSFAEVVKALKFVHGEAFPALNEEDWLDFAVSTFREENGRLVPDYDPAIADGMAALDLSQPLPALWEQFDLMRSIPLMTIRGENSMLLTEDILAQMAARRPDMTIARSPGQGHAPLLHVGGTPRDIATFLDRVG